MMPDDEDPKPRLRPTTPALFPAPLPERLHPWFERTKANLAQPFAGITTDGTIRRELFPLQSTGLSLRPMLQAAQAFLAALSPEQRKQAGFDAENDVWRAWNNMHPFVFRHGICLNELDDRQRELALDVVRSGMSDSAFACARDVMRLNHHLLEITGRDDEFGEWFYWLAIFGTPSATEPWGWQIDGHHLTVSAFVCGDQLVLTPGFMGSEPVHARSGKYAGTRVFMQEEAQGFALMASLSPAQRTKATIGTDIPADVIAAAGCDNLTLPYQGLRFGEMTEPQRRLLLELITTYVGRLREGHAGLKMREVAAHLDETWFAWIGGHDETCVFYYRIHSPVILIEFDHQAGVALVNPVPTRGHIHTLVRTPNGNDFGQVLLRQARDRKTG